MDKATLNLMLSSLEGTPEESISDTISLADGFERLDDLCEGNYRQQLQLVLQRANSIIQFKDRQCKDKDDLINLKDSQCSVMKDDLILSLKKSIEMQNTIDSLKTQLKWKESPIVTNQTETKNQNLESLEDHIKKLNLDLKQHEDKFADYETSLKEKDNQVSKLQDDFKESEENSKREICALEKKINEKDNQLHELLSESNKIKELNVINENFKKQIFELEKTLNETNEKLSKWESKAKANEAGHKNDQLVFGSSIRYSFDPEKNSGVAHIKIPVSFTAPLENSIKDAGPGWMVMQRRLNGKVDFRRELEDFKNSFGDFEGDFWLGLDIVHQLTTSQRCELFIHLVEFNGQMKFARYDHFIIGNRDEKYILKSLGDYSGNAGDKMRTHENGKFQRDEYGCFFRNGSLIGCNLNGYYYDTEQNYPYGIWWGNPITLKCVQMLIKPKSNHL